MPISNNFRDKDNAAWKENATDGGTDRRTCDITTHSKLDDVVNALGGSTGTPFFAEDQRTVAVVGTPETLISEVVPAATTRNISKVRVSCSQPGKFDIKIDSVIVGSGRTNASMMNVEIEFSPNRPATASQTISIVFNQLRGPASDVEAYLMSVDKT